MSGVCELGGGGRGRGEVREWRRDGVLRRGGGVLRGRVRCLRGVSLGKWGRYGGDRGDGGNGVNGWNWGNVE